MPLHHHRQQNNLAILILILLLHTTTPFVQICPLRRCSRGTHTSLGVKGKSPKKITSPITAKKKKKRPKTKANSNKLRSKLTSAISLASLAKTNPDALYPPTSPTSPTSHSPAPRPHIKDPTLSSLNNSQKNANETVPTLPSILSSLTAPQPLLESQNSILRLYNQNTKTLKVCEALEQGKEVVQRDGGGYESIYVSATRNEENGDAESHKMDVLHDGGYEGKEGEKVRNKTEKLDVYICMGKGGTNAGTPREYFSTKNSDPVAKSSASVYNGGWRGDLSLEGRARVQKLLGHCEQQGWPKLICFTGANPGGGLPESHICYMEFRKLCLESGFEAPEHTKFLLCQGSDIGSSLGVCLDAVSELVWDNLPTSNVHVRYALISASYHLCNLNDIHFRSPLRSVLNPLTSRLSEKVGEWNRISRTEAQRRKGWATVEFICCAYPYLDDKDRCTSFLAKCFLIGQELVPILVNIQGVVNKREFFQRSNYVMLSNIRRSLVGLLEQVHDPRVDMGIVEAGGLEGFKLSRLGEGGEEDQVVYLDDVLTDAVSCLGKTVDLTRPAGSLSGSVNMGDWVEAKGYLERAMAGIRRLDPDRVEVTPDRTDY